MGPWATPYRWTNRTKIDSAGFSGLVSWLHVPGHQVLRQGGLLRLRPLPLNILSMAGLSLLPLRWSRCRQKGITRNPRRPYSRRWGFHEWAHPYPDSSHGPSSGPTFRFGNGLELDDGGQPLGGPDLPRCFDAHERQDWWRWRSSPGPCMPDSTISTGTGGTRGGSRCLPRAVAGLADLAGRALHDRPGPVPRRDPVFGVLLSPLILLVYGVTAGIANGPKIGAATLRPVLHYRTNERRAQAQGLGLVPIMGVWTMLSISCSLSLHQDTSDDRDHHKRKPFSDSPWV